MKKLITALLCAAVAVCAASCAPAQSGEATESVTDFVIPTTESETKEAETTSPKIRVERETVKSSDTQPMTDATEKPTSPSKKRKKTEKSTEPTEPPTQGRTRPNTKVSVYVEKGKFEKSDLVFVYDGANIELNDEIEDAIAILGEEDAVDELSKTRTEYTFGDITLITYKSGGVERVEQIIINSEDISTTKNAVIGMYATQLRRIYGDPTRMSLTAYVYSSGNKSLIFFHEDNVVNEIRYKLSR